MDDWIRLLSKIDVPDDYDRKDSERFVTSAGCVDLKSQITATARVVYLSQLLLSLHLIIAKGDLNI